MLLPGNLLTVDIPEHDGQLPAGQTLVVVEDRVRADTDPFVVDSLSRTIERPVGEEDGLFARCRIVLHGTSPIGICTGQCLASVFGNEQEGKPILTHMRETEQPVLVGPCLVGRQVPPACAVVRPARDRRVGKGFARPGVEHKPLNYAVSMKAAHDQRQVTDPDGRHTDPVVVLLKGRIVAGDQEVEALVQAFRCGQYLGTLLIIQGGRQLCTPLEHRLNRKQSFQFFIVDIPPGWLNRILDYKGHSPEKNPGHIVVGYLDVRQRIVPYPLGLDSGGPGLDLLYQVVAQRAADAARIHIPALTGQRVCLDIVSLPVHYSGPLVQCPGSDLVVCPLVHEPLQGRHVQGSLVRPQGLVVAELEPVQIGVNECGLVGVVLMEGQ